MTEQKESRRRRSDEEIIERIREIQPQSSPLTEGYFGGFAEAKSRIFEILYTAPELKKQAQLELLDEMIAVAKLELMDDRYETSYINNIPVNQILRKLEAKRRELEK